MIHLRKLARIAGKSFSKADSAADSCGCAAAIADKGHFVVYTIDGRRFMIPLGYLNSTIFRELFKMSEDVFGFPSSGRITLPCDAVFMDYIVSLVERRVSEIVEEALVVSIATAAGGCSSSSLLPQAQSDQKTFHGY